jgi:hypothetical protein
LLRGDLRLNWADDTGSPVEAESAMEDIDAAKHFRPDDPFALGESMEACLAAASAYAATGQHNKRDVVLAQAAREAQALAERNDYPATGSFLWLYFRYANDENALLNSLGRLWERTHYPFVAWHYVQALDRHGDLDKAVELLNMERGSSLDMLRPFVLAELPEGSSRALEAHKQLDGRYVGGTWPYHETDVLRFLGRRKDAVAQVVDHDAPPWQPQSRRAFFRELQEYNRDRASAEDLFKAAGASRWNQCNAHYFVALTELADGNRDAAHDHFRKAVELGTLEQYTADMSWVFLGRMERDPTWPPWIPVKQ